MVCTSPSCSPVLAESDPVFCVATDHKTELLPESFTLSPAATPISSPTAMDAKHITAATDLAMDVKVLGSVSSAGAAEPPSPSLSPAAAPLSPSNLAKAAAVSKLSSDLNAITKMKALGGAATLRELPQWNDWTAELQSKVLKGTYRISGVRYWVDDRALVSGLQFVYSDGTDTYTCPKQY
jgi:hypothetical protein